MKPSQRTSDNEYFIEEVDVEDLDVTNNYVNEKTIVKNGYSNDLHEEPSARVKNEENQGDFVARLSINQSINQSLRSSSRYSEIQEEDDDYNHNYSYNDAQKNTIDNYAADGFNNTSRITSTSSTMHSPPKTTKGMGIERTTPGRTEEVNLFNFSNSPLCKIIILLLFFVIDSAKRQ